MKLRFAKMHGLGNDFMVVDLLTQQGIPTPDAVRTWGDRRTGVGFDQLLQVLPPDDPAADFRMRIFNADGSEAEQCGNGARCFARFVVEEELTVKRNLLIETGNGSVRTELLDNGRVRVDMGAPSTDPATVPFIADEAATSYVIDLGGDHVEVTPVSMGNPHAVVFVDNVAEVDIEGVGGCAAASRTFPRAGQCRVPAGRGSAIRAAAGVRARGRGDTGLRQRGLCRHGRRPSARPVRAAGQNLTPRRQDPPRMARARLARYTLGADPVCLHRTNRAMTVSRLEPSIGTPPPTKKLTAAAPTLDDDAVAEFLAARPDFFIERPDVLSDMELPAKPGDAISLLERQVIALRSRNRSLREQLTTLLENAKANDRIFSLTTTFTLALMNAPDLPSLNGVLGRCLVEGFDADHATCFIEGWTAPEGLEHLAGVATGEPPLPQLFDHALPMCAAHRPEEYKALFPESSLDAVGSIAIVPLRAEGLNGTLAIGSWDPQRFSPDMGKIFLLYIGDVLSGTLVRLGLGRI